MTKLNHHAIPLAAFLLILASCGREDSSDLWLYSIGDSSRCMDEVLTEWNSLDPDQRAYFQQFEVPSEEFILSLARKQMLMGEISRLNLMQNDDVRVLGRAWMRMETALRARDSISAEMTRSVGDDDILFFMDHIGKTVWYTLYPGTDQQESLGPDHLPELPRQMAVHLDSMTTGEILPLTSGIPVRLDSVSVTDPRLVEEALRDTARIVELAAERFANSRSRRMIDQVADSIMTIASPCIDSAAVGRFARSFGNGTGSIEDTVLVSETLVMTTADLWNELDYYSQFYPISPSNDSWLLWFIDITQYNDALRCYFQHEYPSEYSEIQSGRDEWLMDAASNMLYQWNVYDSITITEQDLLAEFEDLDQLPVIPETRIIQNVVITAEDTAEYVAARNSEAELEEFISECNFWRSLSGDDPPTNLTRPLLPDEIPGDLGATVFDHPAADTSSWSELFPILEGNMFAAYRLVDVIPPHEGTYEELRDMLYGRIMQRRMAVRTEEWLEELDQRYAFSINETLLDSLPADPGMWRLTE